ncbi:ABC transporter ATP-binding protein [Spirochaetia bacterium]|nr:ABC transporter ATP-binding protein [Spirochaetia bacterium]
MALLEIRNLSIAIKQNDTMLTAVNGISFNIEAGEIVGLAGESGCGKTLTALSIPHLLPEAVEITGGRMTFNADISPNGNTQSGKTGNSPVEILSLDEEALCRIRGKDISMIFQEPRQSLNPLIRIGAQIAETLELHGINDKKEAKAAALDMLEKLGFADPTKIYHAYPHQLSGGMCQRVMIGIAAICRPKLLIADEPATALDTAIQDQILELLAHINRDFGAAILFISHDLSVVRRFCTRFLVMYAGRIVEQGPAELLFTSPAHPYTRGLIGAIPRREQRGRALANIPGRVPSIESIEDQLPGCPFAPRCPAIRCADSQARNCCLTAFPPETDLGKGHLARCFMIGAANG